MKVLKVLLIMLLMVGCQSQKTVEKPKDDLKKVSFLAVGDNLMHQRLIDVAKKGEDYSFSSFYDHIEQFIKKADLSFVNQETIIGGKDLKYSGYPAFNTPDEMIEDLSDVGFDIVNGATNHTNDKGEKGILHSIEAFQQYPQITYIGVNQTDVPVVEKNGIKIALLSYTQYSNKKDTQGYIKSFDEEHITKDVEIAKEISDLIIVSAHWGEEYDQEPNAFQKQYAKLFADLGVDVVLGTHSHTLQPVEWVEGHEGNKTLVAYSLGNFVSGMMEEDTQLGGMLSFDIFKDGNIIDIKNVTLIPLVNHYEASNPKNVYDTREEFTVYRLKDYTDELSKKHGLQGYQGIEISIDKMKNEVKKRVTSGIQVDI